MIPSECKMPDLSDLAHDNLMKKLVLYALTGHLDKYAKHGLYMRNLIRLINKSINEYQVARYALIN